MSSQKHNFFLSYAREDSQTARTIFQRLTAAGATVWFDEHELMPGQRWQPAIRSAIRESRYFLALLSSGSVGKKGFVQREIREALDVFAEYPDDEIYMIPIRLDDCRPSHEKLHELNWVDLFPDQEEGIRKLLRLFDLSSYVEDDSSVSIAPEDDPAGFVVIRFDGFYQSDCQDFYWRYLRFYEDGTVISASVVSDNLQKIANWFDGYNNRGSFSLSGRELSFSSKSPEGVIDYIGDVRGMRMILRSHSHINGNRGVTEYRFRKINT